VFRKETASCVERNPSHTSGEAGWLILFQSMSFPDGGCLTMKRSFGERPVNLPAYQNLNVNASVHGHLLKEKPRGG
jgi:hypothetical protein